MKSLVISLLLAPALLTLGAFAHAKPSPVDRQVTALSPGDTVIESGPSGATLESNYFNAPQGTFSAGRGASCRFQFSLFEKTQLAKLCN